MIVFVPYNLNMKSVVQPI